MARFDEIAKIYEHKLSQLRDPQMWEQTLRLTSNFWRLSFCEAMLLTAQNPKAEMCGTFDQWNKVGRYIRRGEHSTAVFKDRSDTQLMYLFDVRQTYGKIAFIRYLHFLWELFFIVSSVFCSPME